MKLVRFGATRSKPAHRPREKFLDRNAEAQG
jgi:hypothetical protein